MTESRDTTRGTSTLSGNSDIQYGAMPEQVLKELQASPGSEFVVIQRTHQSGEPKIWSSGDKSQTDDLFRAGYNTAFKTQRQAEPVS